MPIKSRSWVTLSIIAANVAMFVVQLSCGFNAFPSGETANTEILYHLGSLHASSLQNGDYLRLISHSFLHGSFLHLAFNMVSLYGLAIHLGLESRLGWFRYLLIYILGGLHAAVFSSMTYDETFFAVGASGCICALVGSMAALNLYVWQRTASTKAAIALKRFLLMMLIMAGQMAVDRFIDSVAELAHLSGFLAGFILTLIIMEHWNPMKELRAI